MSTRSCVAEPRGDGWRGRYIHSDGYATGVGRDLWDAVRTLGLEGARKLLIHDHTGWSSIWQANWSKTPGYITDIHKRIEASEAPDGRAPICYCHGDRNEKGWWIKDTDEHKTDQPLHIEWVYVLGNQGMAIYKSVTTTETRKERVKRADGTVATWDSPKYIWKYLDTYQWTAPEPNWEEVEAIATKLAEEAQHAREVAENQRKAVRDLRRRA